MAIVAKRSEKTFTPCPAGTHAAVCVDVVDLGYLESAFTPGKKQHKISIVWQVEEAMENGKPFLVQNRYTLSLDEKANLRRDLESWRGKAFTDAELAGFDVEAIIGTNCLLNVLHNEKQGKVYANVKSVMPVIKGMPRLSAREYVRVVDREPQPTNGHEEPQTLTDDDIPF
jgi:hypothetical protein